MLSQNKMGNVLHRKWDIFLLIHRLKFCLLNVMWSIKSRGKIKYLDENVENFLNLYTNAESGVALVILSVRLPYECSSKFNCLQWQMELLFFYILLCYSVFRLVQLLCFRLVIRTLDACRCCSMLKLNSGCL